MEQKELSSSIEAWEKASDSGTQKSGFMAREKKTIEGSCKEEEAAVPRSAAHRKNTWKGGETIPQAGWSVISSPR